MEEQLDFDFAKQCGKKKEEEYQNQCMKEISQDSFRQIMFHLREIMVLAKWVNMEDVNA